MNKEERNAAVNTLRQEIRKRMGHCPYHFHHVPANGLVIMTPRVSIHQSRADRLHRMSELAQQADAILADMGVRCVQRFGRVKIDKDYLAKLAS